MQRAAKLRLMAAAALASLAAGTSSAWAEQAGASQRADGDDLRAQVRSLTALVQTLAKQDHEQIQALQAQVQALQAQLGQQAQGGGAAGAPSAIASAQAAGAQVVKAQPVAQAQVPAAGQAPTPTQGAGAAGEAAAAAAGPKVVASSNVAIPRVVQNSRHRFAIESPDGQYSIGFTGDIQIDTGDYLNFRPASAAVGPQDLSSGLNARRARIGVAGTAFGAWGFGLVWDAGNSSDQTAKGIETAQIIYAGLPGTAFEIGYSNTFFTLDQATSSNDTLFLERASPSNIATNFNTGDARSNAGVRLFGDRYWIGGYLTGPASGDSHTLTGERLGAFQRVAVQALKGRDYTLHLGFGVDELLQAPNTGNGTAAVVSLSDPPELRIDPTALASTGTVGTLANPVTGGHVLDLETAATFRSLFWQGEFYRYDLQRRGLADADFGGGYGQLSWAITGETHTYNPQAASYFRIFPTNPFSLKNGGWGAWELAARVSYLDLDSDFRTGYALASQPAAVDGSRQIGYTFGVNWYPNDLFRLLLDYNHIDFYKANGTAVKGAALGVPVGDRLDALSLRAQVAF